ncbi:MAG: hypothetical protein M3437_06095 [Chloroflexota bacterium]|nr:hypothetical protein [Chloroflexota bacterium]MDQ5867519.1 hypothetical protein [Chloroflexota bacterium]
MATRGKPRRRKWRKSAPEQPPPPKQEQEQAPTAPPAEQKTAEPDPAEEAKPANVIRKGIYLSALIYVEGDMPAPEDFISPTTKALKSVLDRALEGEHDGLSMTLKKVEVQNNVEQEDEEEAEDGGKEEKFQF